LSYWVTDAVDRLLAGARPDTDDHQPAEGDADVGTQAR
jgi:hypothetical protein